LDTLGEGQVKERKMAHDLGMKILEVRVRFEEGMSITDEVKASEMKALIRRQLEADADFLKGKDKYPMTWNNGLSQNPVVAPVVTGGCVGVNLAAAANLRNTVEYVGKGVKVFSELSDASRVIGGSCGGLGAVGGVVDVGFCIYDLYKGDTTVETCDIMDQRVGRLKAIYLEENDSPAKRKILSDFKDATTDIENLRQGIKNYHNGTCAGRGVGGVLSAVGGGLLIAAAVPEPASPFFGTAGMVLTGIGGLLGGGSQITKSTVGYTHRGLLLKITDMVVSAQRNYANATGRLTEGLAGQPARFSFTFGGNIGHTYMKVTYNTHDGMANSMSSCDVAQNGWYNSKVRIEPGATNVVVTFHSRAGADVFAVDRSKPDRPWTRPHKPETFTYKSGDGVQADFHLLGDWYRYVDRYDSNPCPEECR